MILSPSIKQLDAAHLQNISFDLAIVASGYEERAIFLNTSFKLDCRNKVAISFENYDKINQRKLNDKFLSNLNYHVIKSTGDSDRWVAGVFDLVNFNEGTEFNILVDYSSMTRVWYAAVLNYLRWLDLENKVKINLYFSYSVAKFAPPPEVEVPNKHVGPIKGFYSISLPLKPTALVIGLGYEKIRAFGLTEFLDAETLVFLTDSAHEEFSKLVEKKNEELLKIVSSDNTFRYSFNRLEHLHYVLFSLCEKLTENYRIVIAPCGPKPFSLISLLNAILLKDLDIWRISPGTTGVPQNSVANGEIVVVKAIFEN